MSFGRYNLRSRYRQRDRERNQGILMGVMIFLAVASSFFWMGRQHASVQISSLQKDIAKERQQSSLLQDELTKLRAETQTATSRYDQLQQQIAKDLPEGGPIRDLIDLIRQQLGDGMSAERLAFVLRSARPPRNCTEPEAKRFIVRTPAYSGSDSSVSFGEGAVVISGAGQSAVNPAGGAEAWFDSFQPVTVTFKTADGRTEQKIGTLPIEYSLVSAGREYRFTLSEGEKSFIKVTFDSCDYP
jgi:cell division protein FtsB